MTLNEKQIEFTAMQAYWQVWCVEQGHLIVEAESFRTREQAMLYKKLGKGILNSNHCKKLARDIFLFDRTSTGHHFVTEFERYEAIAEKWKSMHPMARWGGDIPKLRDAVHFSFEHNGTI